MLVSVIIPCYNSEKYLRDTVKSVLNQSYKDIEIILINDGSKDRTWSLIQEIQKEDNRIKGFTQENSGVSSARNTGIAKSKGKYITFLDSDDTYEVDKIAEQVMRLKKTNYKVCYCGNNYIFKDKKISHIYNEEGKILPKYILNTLMIHLNDWMVEASLIKENNILFSESFRYGEDVNFFMKILSLSEAAAVNKQLTNYYIRETSSSFNSIIRNNDEDNYINDFKIFLEKSDNLIYSQKELIDINFLLDNYLLPQVIIRNVNFCNKKYRELSSFEKDVIGRFKFSLKNFKSSLRFYQYLIRAKL